MEPLSLGLYLCERDEAFRPKPSRFGSTGGWSVGSPPRLPKTCPSPAATEPHLPHSLIRPTPELTSHAAFLAYMDVFGYCAIAAFCLVPLAFLFSPTKAKTQAAGAVH